MKQSMKNEADLLSLMNAIQGKLIAIEMKMDTLIHRGVPQNKPTLNPSTNNVGMPVRTTNDHNKGRHMYTAICADCKKECTIPFKPTGDRPVYCQDCFSRRRVMNLSGMNAADKPKEVVTVQPVAVKASEAPKAPVKAKKATAVKKAVVKKKSAVKKK